MSHHYCFYVVISISKWIEMNEMKLFNKTSRWSFYQCFFVSSIVILPALGSLRAVRIIFAFKILVMTVSTTRRLIKSLPNQNLKNCRLTLFFSKKNTLYYYRTGHCVSMYTFFNEHRVWFTGITVSTIWQQYAYDVSRE